MSCLRCVIINIYHFFLLKICSNFYCLLIFRRSKLLFMLPTPFPVLYIEVEKIHEKFFSLKIEGEKSPWKVVPGGGNLHGISEKWGVTITTHLRFQRLNYPDLWPFFHLILPSFPYKLLFKTRLLRPIFL